LAASAGGWNAPGRHASFAIAIFALLLSSSQATALDDVGDEEGLEAPVATPAAVPSPERPKATLVKHSAAGKQPTTCALSPDGRTLYVTNRGDNTVSVLDADTLELRSTMTDVGYSAWGVLPTADGHLLVANWAGTGIAVLEAATGKRLGEIPSGMKPSYLALSADGARVYSTGNFGGEATIGDVKSRKLVKSFDVGLKPMGVAVSRDGKSLYVAVCESRSIARVDLVAQSLGAPIPAPLAATTNLVLSHDGTKLLAAGDDDDLLVVDIASGRVTKIAVGKDPSAVAATPDGKLALVANHGSSSVTLVDLEKGEAYSSIATAPGPLHVETDGRRFWTCNDRAGSVSGFRLGVPRPEAPKAEAAPVPVEPVTTSAPSAG
jgi:YVTN family beta-propeller protein